MNSPIWTLCTEPKGCIALRTEINYFQTHFIGIRMAEKWAPPVVRILGKKNRIPDFVSWMHSAPVLSERAVTALEPLIGEYCEFLPLIEVRGKQLFALNVVSVVDCLDRGGSDILYSSSNPMRILQVSSYAFAEERLQEGLPIFKIPEELGAVFVRKAFVEAVISNGLRGSAFGDPSVEPMSKLMRDGSINIVHNLPQ
jgi:hypothetical protein